MNFSDAFLPIFLLGVILWVIGKSHYFKLSGVSTIALQLAFVLKVFSGLVMFLLYTYYYPVRADADTFKYFDDSKILFEALWSKPLDFFKMLLGINCENDYFLNTYYSKMNNWYLAYDNGLINDGRLMIRLNAVFRICSFGNYHVHSLFLNFISFTGLYSLMRLFIEISGSKWKSYIASFLVPSVIFWSSGILKEAVLIFAVGMFSWNFYKLTLRTLNLRIIVSLFILTAILLVVKLYVFAALITACTGWLLAIKTNRISLSFPAAAIGIIFLAAILGLFFPKYSFIELIVDKQRDFLELSKRVVVHSLIPTIELEYNFISLLRSLPEGLLNTFTRPWPNDMRSILFVPPFIENIFIFGALLWGLFHKRSVNKSEKTFFLFSLTFTLVLFSVIGLTTPIIGAIVRYKIPALPFLVLSVLLLLKKEDIPAFIRDNRALENLRKLLEK